MSKQIQDPTTTSLRTQVSAPLYGAPEALGLDSNGETSEYTNSVDIWSLGCVIRVTRGGKVIVSEFQLSCYFFGKFPFPEDRLRDLSPPIDDVGITLVKSMLVIPPEDRPNAVGALKHVWLESHMGGSEDSREDPDLEAHNRDKSTRGRKSENRLAAYAGPKKVSSERDPIIRDHRRCTQCSQSSGAPVGPGGGTAKSPGRDGTAKRSPSSSFIPTCRAT